MGAFQLVKLLGSPVEIKPILRGAYDNATAYGYGDLVTYNGASYVATGNTTGNLPTNTTYWQVISAKGDTGATGAQGIQGIQGVAGTGVPTGGSTGQALVKLSGTNYDTGWGSAGHTIQEEGTPLASQPALNFIGPTVTVTNNAGASATDVTIAAGGQTTVTKVVASSGGDYTTLGAAIAAASAGWTIQVKDATTEAGAITSSLNNLTIIGSNRITSLVNMAATNLTLSGTGVTIQNMGFTLTTGSVVLSGANAIYTNGYISSASIPTANHLLMSGDNSRLADLYYDYSSATSLGGKTPILVSGLNARIQGCRMAVNGITAGGYVLNASNDGAVVSNCVFKCTTAGQTAALRINGAYSNVTNCYFEGVNNANAVGISLAGNKMTVSGCSFKGWGVALNDAVGVSYLTCTGNSFEIPSSGGLGFTNGNQVTSCVFTGNTIIGAGVTSSVGLKFNAAGNKDITVTGNAFRSLATGVSFSTGTGQSTGCIVTGNTFRSNTTNCTANSTYHNVSVWDNVGMSDAEQNQIIEMKNTSGGTVNVGAPVILKVSTSNTIEFTTTTTAGDPLVYGVLGDDIANNGTGSVIREGTTQAAILRVDGSGTAIAAGDYLTCSTTAARGVKATAGQTAYAIALGASSSSNSIKGLVIRPRVI